MHPYGILSLAPVVIAIVLAIRTRQILPSLFAGVYTAALIMSDYQPWEALVTSVDPLLIDTVADRGHIKVTVFSLLVSALVHILHKSNAMDDLVTAVTRRAHSRQGGMITTWAAGMLVFFDDYANCLVVGGATQGLGKRLGVSKEKLAYLVDSTAAPMATLALVSTWIAYEVDLMGQALIAAGHDHINAYQFFIQGLPYRFYPFLALGFAGAIAFTGRDFGPMLTAEVAQRQQQTTDLPPPKQSGSRAWIAVISILTLVAVTGASLWAQGRAATQSTALFEIIGGADGYDAMLHGSLAAYAITILLFLVSRSQTAEQLIDATLGGFQLLVDTMLVLFLASALASGMGHPETSDYLTGVLGSSIAPWSLPTIIFVLSAAIAFSTGTSFGTMGVLIPLVIPLALDISPDNMEIVLASSAAVLSGATWGDHCSPISDTTVLSSTGTGCDHVAHVRTQLPYAMVAGLASILLCSLPAGLGLSPWICLGLGLAGCVGVIVAFGKRAEDEVGLPANQ